MKWMAKVSFIGYTRLSIEKKTEIDAVAKVLKPSPKLYYRKKIYEPQFKPLNQMPLGTYFDSLSQNKYQLVNCSNPIWCIENWFENLNLKKISKMKYLNICAMMLWVVQELSELKKLEQSVFKKGDLIISQKLSKFENYTLINALSQNNIFQEEAVLKLPYVQCLQWLDMQNTQNEIQTYLQKQQMQKQKSKRR